MKKTVLATAIMAAMSLGLNAQNLITNGSFDEPIDEATIRTTDGIDENVWFVFNQTYGKTAIVNENLADEQHGNVVKIANTTDDAWYRAYLGQKLSVEKEGVYVLSFDIKAVSEKARARAYFKNTYDSDWFIMRNNFNVDYEGTRNQSAVQCVVDCSNKKWKTVKFELDFSHICNHFHSVKIAKNLEVCSVEEEILDNLILSIQVVNKEEAVLIDNVSLAKK